MLIELDLKEKNQKQKNAEYKSIKQYNLNERYDQYIELEKTKEKLLQRKKSLRNKINLLNELLQDKSITNKDSLKSYRDDLQKRQNSLSNLIERFLRLYQQ